MRDGKMRNFLPFLSHVSCKIVELLPYSAVSGVSSTEVKDGGISEYCVSMW